MLQYLFQKRLSLLSIACVLFAGVFVFSCTPEERANLLNQVSNGSGSSQDGGSSQGSGDPPADPSGDFIGAYALDDGTGLTDMYFSFFKGTLSNYSLKQAGKKVVLAEGCLWNTSPNDFSMDNTGEYAIEKGTIYLNGVPYGAVSFSDNQMILAGKTYTRFTDFKGERYSVITVDGGLERTCDYKEQVLNISVSVSRTIPSGKLQVESDSDWLVPGEYANGIYRFSVAGNPIHISRSAQVVFSYLEAETVTLSLCQEVNPSLVKNLSANGSANSYVVSSAGIYSFRTTKGNSSTSVGTVSSAVVLWESYGTSTTPSVGSIINNVSYSSNTITFSTPTTLENGNALIAAKDASGNILWSWHIWVCKDYDPAATAQEYSNNAGTMMDRNLGATSAEPGNVGALGLLYQWGRKDPFLGSSSISSSTKAASTLSWPSPMSSTSSNGTIAYATAHPTTFITYNSSNYDWYYTGSSSTDNTRWQSSKTIYDPCPPGWRVPDGGSSGVWSKAAGSSSYFSYTYDSTNKGMNFSGKFGSASTIWYPAAGYLNDDDGSLSTVGSSGSWWSCTPYDGSAYYLYLNNSGSVYPSDYDSRAYGLSVRCLQE